MENLLKNLRIRFIFTVIAKQHVDGNLTRWLEIRIRYLFFPSSQSMKLNKTSKTSRKNRKQKRTGADSTAFNFQRAKTLRKGSSHYILSMRAVTVALTTLFDHFIHLKTVYLASAAKFRVEFSNLPFEKF